MKKKLLTLFLSVMSVFFVFGAKVSAETISVVSDTKLAFTGGLDRHPDAEQIIEFTSLHNVDIVYITDKPAFDIGGAIPITEASK